jgi:hypothetical protein
VNITFADAEFELTRKKASASGLSLAAFRRASMPGNPAPRAAARLNAERLVVMLVHSENLE